MIRKGLAVAALVIAALSLPHPSAPLFTRNRKLRNCRDADQPRRTRPLNCSSNGIKGIVVCDRTPLPLHSMTVTVYSTLITKKLVDAIVYTSISQPPPKASSS